MPCGGGAGRGPGRPVVAVRRAGGYGRAVRLHRLGIGAWLVQPLYVAVELLVAAAASAAYSLRDDTISSLGQLACGPGHSSSTTPCAPRTTSRSNAAFVLFGLLRVLGAVLLHPGLTAGWTRTAATALWVVSGLCSAAVGFAPVDQHPELHALVAVPVFVLQPLAVLATADALRRTRGAVPSWVVAQWPRRGSRHARGRARLRPPPGGGVLGGWPRAPGAVAGIPLARGGGCRAARAAPAPQCAGLTDGSTSSTRTPPASFGWMKLTRLSLVPRLGAS